MHADSKPPEKTIPGADRRITLNVPKGDIREALRLVAEQGGLNISIGPGVEGEVSVFLTDATLDGALQSIAVDNGYTYKVGNGIISVSKPPESRDGQATPPLDVQVFTLRCQDAERVRDALEFALSKYGKMKVLNENSLNDYNTQRLGQLGGDLEGSNSTANTLQNGQGNQNGINANQLQGGSGATAAGPARNARRLVVTDVPENLRRIADLVADLDQMPPQVLIEARIVEMSTDLQRQVGIDWDINALANGPILNHSLPLEWEAGFASGSALPRTSSGAARTSAGMSLGTVDLSQVTALLQIHESDNAIRLLANPRLLVYNNHSASILVGERYPILTANITDFGTVTESFDTYIPIGVQLEVMPTIMIDGRISLLVHPQTSALGDDVVGTTGLTVARIRTRELSTRVVMNDGQTIALGGLISDRNTRQVSKVPGLGDLWGLSALFRQERPRSERVDLVCFLTARCEGADIITERDREIMAMYEPHFKQIQKVQDVQLHFEVPSEYDTPKPMFGDPPRDETMDSEIITPDESMSSGSSSDKTDSKHKVDSTDRPRRSSEPGAIEDDGPLHIEKTRFDLARSREVRERRARKNGDTNQPLKHDEDQLARERVLAEREAAGLKGRKENDRRDQNSFDQKKAQRKKADKKKKAKRPTGKLVKASAFGVDENGRPIALTTGGNESD
ncbi:MAG: type II secretion system protein GspD [Planctomycetes bacterium]|nr:type II secretion system protein GspD [Planctomycetota bacterium]